LEKPDLLPVCADRRSTSLEARSPDEVKSV